MCRDSEHALCCEEIDISLDKIGKNITVVIT